MFDLSQNIVEELILNLSFEGKYLHIYDKSLIDTSKTNLFYLKSQTKEDGRIDFGRAKEPATIRQDFKIIVQFDCEFNGNEILEKVIYSINKTCGRHVDSLTYTFDSLVIVKEETGEDLQRDLCLLKVNFLYKKAILLKNCIPLCIKKEVKC